MFAAPRTSESTSFAAAVVVAAALIRRTGLSLEPGGVPRVLNFAMVNSSSSQSITLRLRFALSPRADIFE
jgi:hypothetical protein